VSFSFLKSESEPESALGFVIDFSLKLDYFVFLSYLDYLRGFLTKLIPPWLLVGSPSPSN